ncbi:MAG TPA: murein biosynthesis integral membrane protein MurJ, partial [bacterium]|nr:murein biosynthesis integral membrane protein MurJ [bacterium]
MSQKQSLLRSTTIVSAGTFISRILGFIRDSVMAYYFHKSLTDPFYAALRIPNALRQLLAEGALSAAFIPTFTQTMEKEGKQEADDLARSLFVILAFVVSVIVVLGIIFSPQLVRLITPGFSQSGEAKMKLTIHLTQIMFPYLLFVSLAALLMGSLHSLGHFTMPALSPVSLNVCIIAFVVCGGFFVPREKLIYLAGFGFMLGGLTQLLIQYPPLFKMGYYRHLPRLLFHPKIGLVGRLLLPATFGQAVTEVNIFVNLYFASRLIEGSVTYLYFAMRLIQFPLGMFGVALATVSFPAFSRLALLEDRKPLVETVKRSVKTNLFLMIPSALGLVVLGPQIIRLLFDRGQFHRDNSLMPTYYAMCCYLVGILAYSSLKLV